MLALIPQTCFVTLQRFLCRAPTKRFVTSAAIQAGLLPPGSYALGHQGFAQPFMQNPYAMGVQALAGETDGDYGFGYSNGMGYGQESAQIRRDKARGRYMPY